MKTWLSFLLPGQFLVSLLVAQGVVLAPRPITQLTGTYGSPSGEFKVLARGENQLQLEFLGFYEYSTPSGLMVHFGEARGCCECV